MADWLSIAPAVSVKPLWIDDGREVHVVYAHGVKLAMKQWERERLEADGNIAQMHSEFKVRASALGSCPHIVVPLHIICSSEGGCFITYPYAGRSMDRVCADLRDAGQHDKLATQLAEMACAVVLTLQKFQAVKPKGWVHRDVKLENLLLGDDNLVRVADCGNLAVEGDTTTAHDPTYFPPDWAALLPDGRHVFEDSASLAASNSVALDLRGLGMALIKGYAGKLPNDVSLEGAAAFSTCSSCSGSTLDTASCAGSNTVAGSILGSAASRKSRQAASAAQFDEKEKARLLRIAHHDWDASIDELVPARNTAALNQLAKLLMGPKASLPSLAQILQQPAIKAVHRQVLSTVRKAHKPWAAHVAACRMAACHVLAPLMQLESQLLQVYSGGSLSSMPPLSEQFELLEEQYAAQQERSALIRALQEQLPSRTPGAAEQQEPSEPVPADDIEAATQQYKQQQQCTEQQTAAITDAGAVTVLPAYCSSTVNSGYLFEEGAQDSPVSLELLQQASATHRAVLQPAVSEDNSAPGAGPATAATTYMYSAPAAECTAVKTAPAAISSITELAKLCRADPNVPALLAAGTVLLGLVDSTDTELPSDMSAWQEATHDAAAAAAPSTADVGCTDTDTAAAGLLSLGDSSGPQLPIVLCSQQDAVGPMHLKLETEVRLDTGFVLIVEPVAMSAAAHCGPGLSSSLISRLATGSAHYEPPADGVAAAPAGRMRLQQVSEVPPHGGGGDQQVGSAMIIEAQMAAAALTAAADAAAPAAAAAGGGGSNPGNSGSHARSEDGWSSHDESPRSRADSMQGFGLPTTGSDDTWDVDVEVVLPDALEADQHKPASMAIGTAHAWSGMAAPWWQVPPVGMGPAGAKAWVEMQGGWHAASGICHQVAQQGGSASANKRLCRSRAGVRSRIAAKLAGWARSAAAATAVLLEALS